MTIFLVLGLFASLYMLWLLVSLAAYALPVAAGLSLAFWLHGHGHGVPAAVFCGVAGGAAILVAGRLLFACARSPLIRLGIALLFALPAGLAGYHAVKGIAGLAVAPGTALTCLSWGGGIILGSTAWRRFVGPAAIALPANRAEPAVSNRL